MGRTEGSKRADMAYEDLADKLKKHGFDESKASIANKLGARYDVGPLFPSIAGCNRKGAD